MENTNEQGKVISFINMKGGVGKTTLCREIGYTLYKSFHKSILFIDIDPQANLTQSLFEKYNLLPKDLYDDLKEENKNGIKICDISIHKLLDGGHILPSFEDISTKLDESNEKNISLIPGDLKTVFLERSNAGAAAENSIDNLILQNKLKKKFDFIFIDCPPTYSFYTTAAFKASDYYIVPVGVDPYSALGIDLLEQVVKAIKDYDPRAFESKELVNMGIIFNPLSYTSNTTSQRQLAKLKTSFKKSQKLQKYNFYYFTEDFQYNSKYKEQLDYFTTDYHSEYHNDNINGIVSEFLDRIQYLNKN